MRKMMIKAIMKTKLIIRSKKKLIRPIKLRSKLFKMMLI